ETPNSTGTACSNRLMIKLSMGSIPLLLLPGPVEADELVHIYIHIVDFFVSGKKLILVVQRDVGSLFVNRLLQIVQDFFAFFRVDRDTLLFDQAVHFFVLE